MNYRDYPYQKTHADRHTHISVNTPKHNLPDIKNSVLSVLYCQSVVCFDSDNIRVCILHFRVSTFPWAKKELIIGVSTFWVESGLPHLSLTTWFSLALLTASTYRPARSPGLHPIFCLLRVVIRLSYCMPLLQTRGFLVLTLVSMLSVCNSVAEVGSTYQIPYLFLLSWSASPATFCQTLTSAVQLPAHRQCSLLLQKTKPVAFHSGFFK